MSKIEWTDQTWNPVIGCTPVSPGCLNCYAADQSPRLGAMGQKRYVGLTVKKTDAAGEVRDVFNGRVELVESQLHKPLGRKKPTRYFIASMGDLFHEAVPFEFIDRVFAVMALCPQHTFQVLTKRPERMAEYLSQEGVIEAIKMQAGVGGPIAWPLPNVWLGTSAEDQTRLEERMPHLLKCPAAVRFLSCEPLLGPLVLNRLMSDGSTWFYPLSGEWGYCGGGDPDNLDEQGIRQGIDWVIVGGESGPQARICEIQWIRGVVAQCKGAGVPVFVKQLGKRPVHTEPCGIAPGTITVDTWDMPGGEPEDIDHAIELHCPKGGDPDEWPEDLRVREFPDPSRALTASR